MSRSDLDYYIIVMLLGNTCNMPAIIIVGENKDDIMLVTIEAECDIYI